MKKRKKSFPKITVLLLAASAVLLVGSGVGSARAALTYYSENYSAQMNMPVSYTHLDVYKRQYKCW